MPLTRRQLLASASYAAAAAMLPRSTRAADAPQSLIASIDRQLLWHGRDKGTTTWFHPRACMVPSSTAGGPPVALMTLQEITGSDYFGPVHFTESRDAGRTWSDPKPVPGLGRQPADAGHELGVCDTAPEYHARTRTVLAIGQQVYYRGGKLAKPQPRRRPVYITRDAAGQWSTPQILEWDDPRAAQIYSANCAQRLTLDNGDVLIPLSFGTGDLARSVATVRCTFDGKQLTVQSVGNELKMTKARGFLEPSLAKLGDAYYMTIRAEDNHGYVTRSADGLQWDKPTPWSWDDDGSPLMMSTTQQRWLPHADGLLLAYTRKATDNVNVMRWRAPLYVAEVDPATLRLRRATERVVFPMIGDGINDPTHVAHYGNFHTTAVSPTESWITSGEVIPANYRGDTLLARVTWSKPNRNVT